MKGLEPVPEIWRNGFLALACFGWAPNQMLFDPGLVLQHIGFCSLETINVLYALMADF